MWNRILSAAIVIITFASCEDSMILKSEKKMKEDLQGTWQKSFQGKQIYVRDCQNPNDSSLYDEYWIFEGSNYYTTFRYDPVLFCDRGAPDQNITDNVDTAIIGTFKVDARILDAFLKLKLITQGNDSIKFIDKWEFVTLDDDVLYLATDDPNSNSVLQLEFSKLK